MKLTTFSILLAAAYALTACSNLKDIIASPAGQTAVKAVETETESLLKTFVFTAASDKLAGANWSDSAAAAIYASQGQLAADPTGLNALLGTFLPANSTWTPVIDGLVSKLISGGLNTKAERIAALSAAAQTFNAQAATARAAQ